MKKLIAFLMLVIMSVAPLSAYADEAVAEAEKWDMSVPAELTEDIQTLFDKAMENLVGVHYTPVAVLGVKGDTICILCKARVVYPGAEPYNVLVYVGENGIQNIYELWIEKHAERETAGAVSLPEHEPDEKDQALPGDAPGEGLSGQRIIEEMAVDYGSYGEAAYEHVRTLLENLRSADADAADRWDSIMALWKTVNTDLTIHENVLPDGLPDTDELCIVALGFQLNADGSMRDELIERLKVVLNSAEKYPNALIVCTGGGTAAENKAATEAGKMAEWLIANGIPEERVIIEDRSLTTAQNAIYTYNILTGRYPQVKRLAIVSSDYHIATGTLLFEAEAILRAEKAGGEAMHVVSNAAWKAPSGSLSAMFQAGALIELSGDVDTAYEIYYNTYDIHELPQLS